MSTPPTSTSKTPWLGLIFIPYAVFCLSLTYGLITWTQNQEVFVTSQETKAQARDDSRALRAGRELVEEKIERVVEIPTDIPMFKQKFYGLLLPAIQRQNDAIRKQRQQLEKMATQLQSNGTLSLSQQATLETWALRYRAPNDLSNSELESTIELVQELLVRVDEVPESMALAQAAMESAWGRSRFAKEVNNYFGQWCFTAGCGIVPSRRPAGAKHEVARFKSLDAAVAAYMLNINSHTAYDQVRALRAEMRQAQQPLNSLRLTQGLEKYSERGAAYIHDLNGIIRFNKLKQFDAGPIQIASKEEASADA